MKSLINKFVQNGSFNGGPDAALESALDSGRDTIEFTLKTIEDVQEGEKKDAIDVLLDGALKYEHVSAVDGFLDDSSKGKPTSEV